jgi:hypothetical protein
LPKHNIIAASLNKFNLDWDGLLAIRWVTEFAFVVLDVALIDLRGHRKRV